MDQRLNQQSAQQLGATAELRSQPRNFDEAEEVIRADREQTGVPETLVGKLAEAIAVEPPRAKPWWKRMFG